MSKSVKALVGATLIDGTGAEPVAGMAVVISEGRFSWIGPDADCDPAIERIDVSGKYLIPGLLDANVHLLICTEPGTLLQHDVGAYDDLILEAAQVALRGGITTVFDTCGPLDSLRRVRDGINAGTLTGARIFYAGNIVGMGGPWTDDFHIDPAELPEPDVVAQVNAAWEQGTGQELLTLPASEVGPRVRDYIKAGDVDFIKYSSSSHGHRHLIAFSPDAQSEIVREAHEAGLKVQACTIGPEALKIAINAGCDLIQHADITGPHPMPAELMRMLIDRQVPSTAFLETEAHLASMPFDLIGGSHRRMMESKEQNDRDLVRLGAPILMAHDMGIYPPHSKTGQMMAFVADHPGQIGSSHVFWQKAAREKGMCPMDALLAATRDIAKAYGKLDDFGTIEPGKYADCVVLDANPLEDAENFRRIVSVFKQGVTVDRAGLPEKRILTREMELPPVQ